jgi:Relaxase/Mobilisation nuclease domain
VWHCSLNLAAEEGQLPDEQWARISEEFVEAMGFAGEHPCRWTAVRHGLSKNGNDHVHLVVSLVREDGTKANVWNARPRAQQACGELERRHGLQVLESRAAGRGGVRGEKRGEREAGARRNQTEGARLRLERVVRGAAAAALNEAEFVRRVRRAGVQLRPRYTAGRDDVVAGYSAALRPPAGQAPIWYGGGHLARDRTLPRLRDGWPDTPQQAAEAVAEWGAARRNRRVAAAGREQQEPDPQLWARYATELGELRDRLRLVPADDRATWAHVARETSGAFAAWSLRIEPEPGPLAATARQLARSAQLHAHQVRPRPAGLPSAGGAAMLLSSAARGGRGPFGEAALLRQLANTANALHDAHLAVGEARTAGELAAVVRKQVETVSRDLAVAAPAAPAPGVAPRPAKPPVPGACPIRPPTRRLRARRAPPAAPPGAAPKSNDEQGRPMHPHEPDGINETLAGTLRVGLTVAGQLAERAARAREQQAREAQAATEQQARELQARLDAERAAARAALASVHRPEWWRHAEPDQIARAWQTAQTWRDLDPDARLAGERISDELRARYELDTRELGADPAAVRDALAAHDAAARSPDRDAARSRGELDEAAAYSQPPTASTAPSRPAAAAASSPTAPAASSSSSSSRAWPTSRPSRRGS